MSQSGSRGRTSLWRRLFEVELGPGAYLSDNLVAFVKQAGEGYIDRLNDRLKTERERLKARGVAHTSKVYKDALQKVRFDMVAEIQEDSPNLIRRLPEASAMAAAKQITSEEVTNIFTKEGGRTLLLELIEKTPAEGFKLNALTNAAKLLAVKGVSASKKDLKGDEARVAVRDLILGKRATIRELDSIEQQEKEAFSNRYTFQQLDIMSVAQLKQILTELGLDTTGTRQAIIRRVVANQPAPTIVVKYTQSSLKSMKVDQLRNILRNLKLKVSGVKDELISRILTDQGAGAGEEAGENVDDVIAGIRDSIEDEGAIPSRAIASKVSPDTYEKATVASLKELTRLLHLEVPKSGPTATKAELIESLTGAQSTAQLSRGRVKDIQTNLALCEQSTMEELTAIASELKINIRGLDKVQVCQKIYENYLLRFSTLLIEQLGPGGKNTLSNLASMPVKERRTAIEALARNAKYAKVSTLPDLMREFLLAHYRARALRFAPDSLDIINDYLSTGLVPDSMRELEDLARVFNDINPDLFTLDDPRALSSALFDLYGAFIGPVTNGGQGSTQLLINRFASFNYSPARRNRGALSRNRLPMSPTAIAARVPLPFDEDDNEFFDNESNADEDEENEDEGEEVEGEDLDF